MRHTPRRKFVRLPRVVETHREVYQIDSVFRAQTTREAADLWLLDLHDSVISNLLRRQGGFCHRLQHCAKIFATGDNRFDKVFEGIDRT